LQVLGSHIEHLREEAADSPEGGEMIDAGVLWAAPDVTNGMEDAAVRC
jgi:hypothetical protein